ncbi:MULTISPECIES: hypothetical protein [Ensifer]|jgi:hypothetical protein|uniref:Secreted protein n=1 Tax=Ensifer canadensis TaxID=555315 RepID=A0AAW4FIV3_9HYPH|nr:MULTISPECIES: hypothetical protein [Ensifer]MDP9628309.1 hypothetical protein [Ensifer adhaerens]MBD9486292.1 hypothetical protein [Ensifer sp. ENS11]MBM3090981.1 hypothetical protein [Ensifer canadensis]NOV15429.1 hypothetical protein [Ensifer canadensis]UBI75960.1 hypothetical protein J3R84_02005 [Ensifer canadensis]
MQIPFAKKIAQAAAMVCLAAMSTGRRTGNPGLSVGVGQGKAAQPLCCAQAVSQKKFGEWGLHWYSRPNEKSRKRLERPKGFARRDG